MPEKIGKRMKTVLRLDEIYELDLTARNRRLSARWKISGLLFPETSNDLLAGGEKQAARFRDFPTEKFVR